MTCRSAAFESRITPPRTLSPPRLLPLNCFDNRPKPQYIVLVVTYTVCSENCLLGSRERSSWIPASRLSATTRTARNREARVSCSGIPSGSSCSTGACGDGEHPGRDWHPAPCRVVQWTLVVTEEDGAVSTICGTGRRPVQIHSEAISL